MAADTFSYYDADDRFVLMRRGVEIAQINRLEVTNHFMRWLVDLLNKNHAEFVEGHTTKLIREMGF